MLFQPSLPARGATNAWTQNLGGKQYFNPRSPRGERLDTKKYATWLMEFQPSLPARGATRDDDGAAYRHDISTLAPREGSDPV